MTIHKKRCRKHSRKRIVERYGIKLSQAEFIALKRRVDKKAHRIPQIVYFNRKPYNLVWDSKLNEIVTFLPCRAFEVLKILTQ